MWKLLIQRSRVSAMESLRRGLGEEVELEVGVGGGEEDDLGVLEGGRDFGAGFDEDVEVDRDGGGFVHGGVVGAGPAEGFGALAAFEAGDVDVGMGEGPFEFLGEILADDGDEADLGEGGGGPGEVDGAAADDVGGGAVGVVTVSMPMEPVTRRDMAFLSVVIGHSSLVIGHWSVVGNW